MRLATNRYTRPLLLASLLTVCLAGVTSSPSWARAKQREHAAAHPGSVVTTFRLRVAGRPAPNTTFWVAYGPLQGRWGVIRLAAHRAGVYSAWALLPANGRTTFAYLAGQGTIQTKMGPAPGGVPTTIAVVGPTTAANAALVAVHWRPPAG
jgi:hypothetical protein